jgi:glycosyltransferase involved in cell wall biosynthesis
MKVLFVSGYQKSKWSLDTWINKGAGGTEYMVLKLAHFFKLNGHDVVVTGEVDTANIDGVDYVDYEILSKKYKNNKFDIVICTNYIHYILELAEHNITYDKSYFWIHNNEYYPWWNGMTLDNDGYDFFLDDRMTNIILVSNYQKQIFLKKYPELEHKVLVIPNGIDLSDWNGISNEKIPNRFIYSSAPDRGLKPLLRMWPKIKTLYSDATLIVTSPPYALEWYDSYKDDLDGVTFYDGLSPKKLYNEISKSEYWLYPSKYDETFCITALEMMQGGVKILTTDTGNLLSLIQGCGIIEPSSKKDSDLESSLIQQIGRLKNSPSLSSKILDNSKNKVKQFDFPKIYKKWIDTIEFKVMPDKLHPELYTYYDNAHSWKERFITYSAKTKEWDLIVDEPFTNTFSFPLFTPEFCKMIREEAEYADAWTVDRHENYPTTDMILETIGMHDIYMDVLKEYIMPLSIHMWELEGKGWDNLTSENFLARYTPNAQGHLSIHHDMSDITCLVQLSDLSEYEGGGTWFRRQKELVKNDIGYVTLHPGNITHKHGARAVSSGKRYIIVSFMRNTER